MPDIDFEMNVVEAMKSYLEMLLSAGEMLKLLLNNYLEILKEMENGKKAIQSISK